MGLVSLPALFVFVAAFATRSSADYNISCAVDIHYNCDREYALLKSSKGMHQWSEEDLSIYCRDIVDNVDCKQEYLEKCGNETDQISYAALTQDLRNLSAEICNETSDLRAAFRLHNDCIRNSSGCSAFCVLRAFIKGSEEELDLPNNATQAQGTVKVFCRIYELMTECVTARLRTACGQDAGNFVNTILNRLVTTLRTPFCIEGKWDHLFRVLDDENFQRKLREGTF